MVFRKGCYSGCFYGNIIHMFDLVSFIKAASYAGVTGIIFAESGLLVGFFLPGDSLLFTAGFMASQGYLDIMLLVVLAFSAAALGDQVGYLFGKRVGPKIFIREKSWFFDKEHVKRAHDFYEVHGGKAVTLARFMPVVRTFAPIVAGVGNMRYRSFVFFNLLGALLWGAGLPLAGYFLGRSIPSADKYLLPIVAAIIIISVLPSAIHLLKHHWQSKKI